MLEWLIFIAVIFKDLNFENFFNRILRQLYLERKIGRLYELSTEIKWMKPELQLKLLTKFKVIMISTKDDILEK